MLVAHLATWRYSYTRIQIDIKGSVDSLFPLAPRQQEHAAGGAGVLVVEEVGGVDPCNKGQSRFWLFRLVERTSRFILMRVCRL